MKSAEQKAELIKQTREFMRLSQKQFGELMGYSEPQIVRYEKGDKYPSESFWKRMDYIYRGYLKELDKQIKKTAVRAA